MPGRYWPVTLSSSGPSLRALAPVATMMASAVRIAPLSSVNRKGRAEKSTSVTASSSACAPKRIAWASKSSIISGPSMPLGKPG